MKEVIPFLKSQNWPERGLVLPKLQAHRGYWQDGAKENTLEAFRAAKAKGAEMFEFDVRLSVDDIPVVFHDPKLTRLAQINRSVEDLTARELQAFAGAPLLREVLEDSQVPRFFNIEIKSQRSLLRPIEEKVVEIVRSLKLEDRVLFSSFNPIYIHRLSKIAPEIPRALLATVGNEKGNYFFVRRLWMAPWLKFQLLHLDKRMVTKAIVQQLKDRGVPVAVWTVNEPEEVRKYLDWGCVSVISDTTVVLNEGDPRKDLASHFA